MRRREDIFLTSGTVNHVKESECIYGWWDSETPLGRVDVFLVGGTVRHKKEEKMYF
jgi:hypothetical protein